MAEDLLTARIAALRARTTHVLDVASPSPDLMRANAGVYGAVEKLLALHSPVKLAWTDLCPKHWSFDTETESDAKECPDCRPVEYTACARCRNDADGMAAFDACELRAVITGSLARGAGNGD